MAAINYININGSEGEGGGQVLRTSLALSVCFNKPFIIENIRAKRKKPGLLRQHLTAVKAAARISNAKVEGDTLGSQHLLFEPNQVQAGEYNFSIETAGSATLVLQTIMLPLLFANGVSRIAVEGGTHNPLAPPFEFLRQAYLPLLAKMGAVITAKLIRPGFFPRGGGRIEVEVQPLTELNSIKLTERGKILAITGDIYLAGLPLDIAEREIDILANKLKSSPVHFKTKPFGIEYGPGNVISVTVKSENICEVFTGYGQKGVRAEIVAKRVVDEVQRYISSCVPVDAHLADQLLLPMALAGAGEFVTCGLTQHTETNMRTINRFLNVDLQVNMLSSERFRVKLISDRTT